jgi:hypothetical protein
VKCMPVTGTWWENEEIEANDVIEGMVRRETRVAGPNSSSSAPNLTQDGVVLNNQPVIIVHVDPDL